MFPHDDAIKFVDHLGFQASETILQQFAHLCSDALTQEGFVKSESCHIRPTNPLCVETHPRAAARLDAVFASVLCSSPTMTAVLPPEHEPHMGKSNTT
eukprot:5463047-Amphidinium_carterae.1